jgi:hypothetical protein
MTDTALKVKFKFKEDQRTGTMSEKVLSLFLHNIENYEDTDGNLD